MLILIVLCTGILAAILVAVLVIWMQSRGEGRADWELEDDAFYQGNNSDEQPRP